MRVLEINSVCGIRSTGRIAADIAKRYEEEGHECKIAYGRGNVPEEYKTIAVKIGTKWDLRFHAASTRLFDNNGFCSKSATREFLKWADRYDPDILWLHNIHGYYINIEYLFNWIKSRPQMEVKWTLHDCWSFTGHCPHFSAVSCDKWKTECGKCVQKNRYPSSFVLDNSKNNFNRKKELFCGVKNLTLIVPSHWLESLVKKSFLREYKVEIVYNEIDKNVFKPTQGDFRERMSLSGRKIVLGVASTWTEQKGLYDFYELSQRLDDSYAIVLVGLSDRQIKHAPANITCVKRTENVKKLTEIYTSADIFVNPSKEETFGMTTLEALSCGTDVIVYRDTACEEIVAMYGGTAVEKSVDELYKAITEKC